MPVVVTAYRKRSSAFGSLWSTDSQAIASFMGVPSIRCRDRVGAFFIARPFDTKIITARVGIPNVDIGYRGILQQQPDLGLDDTIGNIPLGNQSPPRSISIQGEPVRQHVDRKAGVLRIALAVVLVNENRARQRELLLSVERVVGEQDPTLPADGEGFQALPTGPIARRHFSVRRMAVAGPQPCLADGICDSVADGHYAIRLHCFLTGGSVCFVVVPNDARASKSAISESCGQIPRTFAPSRESRHIEENG